MFTKLRNRESGFTIIEVLIVLAIAGLIMLVVFLAVPALQRNSRNTQRKNDVSSLLGALTEYINNNNGKLPTTSAEFYTASQNAKFGFYASPTSGTALGDFNFTYNSNTAVTATANTVYVKTGAKCNTTGNNFGGTNNTSRNIAVVYTVETGGGTQVVCQES
jgi:prepilin-type N-terminal cleavage/methylation domain-containing protein